MKAIECRNIKKHVPLVLLVVSLLAGCGGGRSSVPKKDLMEALKKSMPEGVELTDVSYEIAPVSNGQNSSNAAVIVVKTKIQARAAEDLFSAPTDPADIKPVNDYIGAYNAYVAWANALQATAYASEVNRDKPKIEAKVPKFLHRDQVKGETFTGYCDVMAEHQVDRWIFQPAPGVDWGEKKPSRAAAKFGPDCVGANTPEGVAVVQQLKKNEDTMDQFRKRFAEKHAAESGPVLQVLKPLLTGGQEFQTLSKGGGMEVPNDRFTFSEYDPRTNHFRVKFRNIMGGGGGPAEIDGGYVLIFQDAAQYVPFGVSFVGSYDAKTGDLTLNQKNGGVEVLHTAHR